MAQSKGTATAAIILVGLLTASGAVIYTQQMNQPEAITICADDEIKVDGECIIEEIFPPIHEDCTPLEVEVEEGCRPLQPPSNLQYNIDSNISLGDSIHWIPSFDGDGPDAWSVIPELPSSIHLNRDSGEISGAILEIPEVSEFVIVASNLAGMNRSTLILEVLDRAPAGLDYPTHFFSFVVGVSILSLNPTLDGGGEVVTWSLENGLPSGLVISTDGVISGTPQTIIPCSTYTINASNSGGWTNRTLTMCVDDQSPFGLFYPAAPHTFTVNTSIGPLAPWIDGGEPVNWEINPDLPIGMEFDNSTGWILGSSPNLVASSIHQITASNSGGSSSTSVEIIIIDEPVVNLSYGLEEIDLAWLRESIDISPTHSGGAVVDWTLEPSLPTGLSFDEGRIYGSADTLYEWTNHTIWANNTGGSSSAEIRLRIADMTPMNISWDNSSIITLASNESIIIEAYNEGPEIDSWEVEPALPLGLELLNNGSINGTPIERTAWRTYHLWANNTGGTLEVNLSIAVHDLDADWLDLVDGVGTLDYGSSWPSLIVPVGRWTFPVGLDWNDRPIISAGHSGKGRVVGYGHEGFVAKQGGSNETTMSLNAIKWACGGTSKTIGVQSDYSHFEDELTVEGYNVISNAWPDDLSSFDCFIGDFWNSYSNTENNNLESFILSGKGAIFGGHAWYWSYSNSDVAHNYPGNKVMNTTGLFVSSSSGSVSLDLTGNPPSANFRLHTALTSVESHLAGQTLSVYEKGIAASTVERAVDNLPLDFDFVWAPVRKMTNESGWIMISPSNTFSLANADPIERLNLKIQDRLLLLLPIDQIPYHPSTKDFPGDVPANASRVSRTVEINGTFAGLPSSFGYSGARSAGRMSTGLYAAAGEVLNVTFPNNIVGTGVDILIGAHTDNLWGKDTLSRHPIIYRTFSATSTAIQVGCAFGGTIYIRIPAGSTLGSFNVSIDNAVLAPYWVQGETDQNLWNSTIRDYPAPWAEVESEFFILSVPSADLRTLDTPDLTMDFWDQALSMEHNLSGFTPWPRVERATFDVQISAGWMHSGYPFMAHTASSQGVLNSSQMWSQGDWGMFHELGHNHQWMASTLPGNTETTCNLYSVRLMEDLVGLDMGQGHGAMSDSSRKSRTETYFQNGAQISSWSVWTALETFVQIKEEFGWGPVTAALTEYYTMADSPSGDDEEFNRWVIELSLQTGYNLAPYHEAWGFPLSQETKDDLLHLPVWVDDPLRTWVYEYDIQFRNNSAANVSSTSADLEWDVYDNGSNTNITICWGLLDAGNNRNLWDNCASYGVSNVGHDKHSISGLLSQNTYYFRVFGENSNGETWSNVTSFTTS